MPKEGEEEEVEEEVEISGMAGNVVVGCMPRGVPVTIVYGDTHCNGCVCCALPFSFFLEVYRKDFRGNFS